MIEEYIILVMLVLLTTCLIIGVCSYIYNKRASKFFEEKTTNYPKSMIGISESKIIELPVRKEKKPLYVFKDGKKTLFKKEK